MPDLTKRPDLVRSRIAAGAALFLLLAVCAIRFSSLVLRFGMDALAVFQEFGIKVGLEILHGDFQDLLLTGSETGFEAVLGDNGLLRSAMLMLASFDAVVLFLAVFAGSWLFLAGRAFRLLVGGILDLTPDLEPTDVPAAFAVPSAVATQLRGQRVVAQDLSKTERLVLGRYGPYLPDVLLPQARSMALPVQKGLGQVLHILFFGALAVVVILGTLLLSGQQLAMPLPPLGVLVQALSVKVAEPLIFWTGMSVLLAGLVAMLDFRFMRALVPGRQPAAGLATETLRDLSWNGTPPQLISAIKADFRAHAGAHVHRMTVLGGQEDARTNFSDQSAFHVDLLIEAPCRPAPAYFARVLQRLGMIGFAMQIAAAALLLLMLAPAPLRDLFAGRPVEATAFLATTVHMVLVLAVSRRMFREGQRYVRAAEALLEQIWYETPLALVSLDGTVNTQRVMTGKGLTDSTGTDSQQQELRFHVSIDTATAAALAPGLDGQRVLWSFAPDAASDALGAFLVATLLKEGNVSVLNTAQRTLRDTEAARDRVEDHRKQRELPPLPPVQQNLPEADAQG